MQITPQQEKKLKKIIALGEQGLPALLEYLFELEEKMDKDIPTIKGLIAKVKGDKGDEYKITEKDYKEIASIVRALINDDKIADKVLSMIDIDYDVIAKKASEYITVPKIDYDKIISSIEVENGKDADEEVIKDKVVNTLESKLPQFGDKFRDGLELLNGDDRLDKSAIKGIDDYEEISRLAREPRGRVGGVMGIKEIVAGTNITVDNTNLGYPVISSTGGGGGSGNVTKVGTPVNNQVGVWTGDGTLEGDATLTYDGFNLTTPSLIAGGLYYPTGDGTPAQTIITDGGGNLSWYSQPLPFIWYNRTTSPPSGIINTGFVANDTSIITVRLPTTAPVGSTMRVAGSGSGGWQVTQNAGEQIIWNSGGVVGTNCTTVGTGGYLASTDQYDAVELVCIVADTVWSVISSKGNISIT